MRDGDRIFIFLDNDLDGAGCCLAIRWLFPKAKISFKPTNEHKFREDFLDWCKTNSTSDYDQVYICDLNIVEQNQDILDVHKITIIDHHNVTGVNKEAFSNASYIFKKTPSCATLVYKTLCGSSTSQLTREQKLLLLLIDDYDSYKLSLPYSLDLNTIFFSLRGDRIALFCDEYINGFKPFDPHKQNIIKFHKLRLKEVNDNLKIHSAVLKLDGKDTLVHCTFADYGINDVAQHLFSKYNSDIAIVVNLTRKTVSYRRGQNCSYDVSKLAKKFNNGGGRNNVGGGILTDNFLLFSRLFKEI